MSASASFDPMAPLTPSGNLRRRQLFSRVAEYGATAAAVLAVAVLAIVIYTVVTRGASALSLDFLVKAAPTGIGPELVGTGDHRRHRDRDRDADRGADRALPDRVRRWPGDAPGPAHARPDERPALDHHRPLRLRPARPAAAAQSGIAAAVALAIIEVPLIARGTQEVLLLVPPACAKPPTRSGSAAGARCWGSILPSALGGIVTATVLSVARAAGETAPLIFAASVFDPSRYSLNPSEALPNVPVRIFQLSEEANPTGFTEAWGLSFVLVSFILFASLGARGLLARSRRKLTS